jgi:hypothetical protein
MSDRVEPERSARSPFFAVHVDHDFEGFEIVRDRGRDVLVARCGCGEILDTAEAVFRICPECGPEARARAASACGRCGGSGQIVDHARLTWRAGE